MTSYLEKLLCKKAMLELHEEADLRVWLQTLEKDCEMFGETPQDTTRMNAIRQRVGDPIHKPIEPNEKSG